MQKPGTLINVYRIYELGPQSLNAHINSFHPFIHPDDRVAVLDAFEKAYEEELPLHIEYRIVLPDGQSKYVQQITKWMYSVKGQLVFAGILRDVTEERKITDELFAAQSAALLNQQLLKLSEQKSATGHWHINLVTRRASFSDNYYRIYGVKQNTLPLYNSFLNLVHPEDRNNVRDAIDQMYREHALPEIEFRIIRPDGKMRILRQTGRSFIAPNKEMIMIGVVQDITVLKGLENKIAGLNDIINLNRLVTEMTESVADVSSITWLPDGYMRWSDGFYQLLGYRPGSVEPISRLLYKSIHSKDLMLFKNAEAVVMNGQPHEDIVIRTISKAGIRLLKFSFRQFNNEGEGGIAIGIVQDITRQKALQEELSNSKSFGELVINSVKDIILFTNTDNVILHWNEEAEKSTGITKEDALQNNLFDVLPRLNEEDFLGQLHFALRGNEAQPRRAANAYIRKMHDYQLFPLKNEIGEVLGLVHVVRDVSEQLMLQQQLSERLNFIESLVESSVDRIVVLDRFMNYLYWNKKAEEYYGISKEKVLGRNILEVFPSFRNNTGYGEFRKVLKGEAVHLPASFYEESNEYAETYLIPIKDETGDVTAVLWTVHDLSKEYRLTKERTEVANLLQATMNASKDMIQVFEAVRNEEGEIVDFKWVLNNYASEKIYGDVIGKSLLELNPGVIEEGIFETFKKVVETGIPDQSERQYTHEQFNGWFYQSTVRLNDGVATTTRDITERKKTEQEILHLKDEITQRAKDKYEGLFKAIDDGFCVIELIYDEKGRTVDFIYRDINPSFVKQTGIEAAGKKRSEVFTDLQQSTLDNYGYVAKTGEPVEQEYTIRSLNNRWFQTRASRVGGDGSNLVAVIFRDITFRKRAEERQAFLLKLADAIKQLMNPDEIMATVSEMVGSYYKVGRCGYAEVPPPYDHLVVERDWTNGVMQSLQGSIPLTAFGDEIIRQYRTGQTIVVEDAYEDARNEGKEAGLKGAGNIRSGIAVQLIKRGNWVASFYVQDTVKRSWRQDEIDLMEEIAERTWAAVERAKVEEALRQSEEKYRTLFNSVDEAVVWCQIITDENGKAIDYRLLELNPAFEKMTGLTVENSKGKTAREVVPNIEDWWIETYAKVAFEGEVMRFENRVEELGRWFNAYASPVGDPKDGQFVLVYTDVSERKKAEEALLQSEEQLKNFNATLEQQINERTAELQKSLTLLRYTEYLAQSGTWDYEVATGNFKWSEGMYKLFGLSQQRKVTPEIYLRHAIEQDRPVAKKIVALLQTKHDPFEEILRIKRNGDVRTIKVKGSVITDENGKAQRIIGVDVDITNIQKAEDQLKESRHWLEQTAKASPDSITIYDVGKKQPIYLNNCLAEWLGMSSNDLLEMGFEERLKLIYPDDQTELLQNNEKAATAKDNDTINMEYRLKTNDGKTIWVRNRSKPFQRDDLGKVTHILSILQNVTEEVQLREELKQRTQYAESIIDASIDRIAVYDKELRVIAWNRRAEEVTGRKRQDVLGKKLFDVFPKVGQDEELLKAHLDALKGSYVSVPAKRGTYTNNYYERFFIPLKNERKETYAIVSVMHDVSELVNRNAELYELNQSLEQKNEELEQKNEEITSFAFVASHDMKEPLRKIHTFSDWLIEQEAEQLSEKGKSMMEKMNTSVHRMEALIDDILVLTKIHSDTRREEEVNLNKVLRQVFDNMFEQISLTQTGVHSDQLPVIKGNSNQIFYLFHNLISNAIKFQKPGNVPQIKITAEIVSGEETGLSNPYDEYAKISFADNGFGFDQRYAKKIFQVFQRLHGRHEFEGTGIGLAICKKIMENHEGMITVESEQGKGSVFSCYFPLF